MSQTDNIIQYYLDTFIKPFKATIQITCGHQSNADELKSAFKKRRLTCTYEIHLAKAT